MEQYNTTGNKIKYSSFFFFFLVSNLSSMIIHACQVNNAVLSLNTFQGSMEFALGLMEVYSNCFLWTLTQVNSQDPRPKHYAVLLKLKLHMLSFVSYVEQHILSK